MSLNKLKLRFVGTDQYGSLKFSSTASLCPDTYESLRTIKTALEKAYKDAYQPLYQRAESKLLSVRTNRSSFNFQIDEEYSMSIKAVERTKQKDGTVYPVLKIIGNPVIVPSKDKKIDLMEILSNAK